MSETSWFDRIKRVMEWGLLLALVLPAAHEHRDESHGERALGHEAAQQVGYAEGHVEGVELEAGGEEVAHDHVAHQPQDAAEQRGAPYHAPGARQAPPLAAGGGCFFRALPQYVLLVRLQWCAFRVSGPWFSLVFRVPGP